MNPIPTVSTSANVTDPLEGMSEIWKDYMASEYSQTILYRGRVKSLPYLVMTISEETALRQQIIEDLEFLYKCHYEAVDVMVEVDETEAADNLTQELSRYRVSVSIRVTEGNKHYDLAHALRVQNKSIMSVKAVV